ncbi:S-adenosylmethionine:tRNA ribosyltransferase-isomerase [Pleomorphovibrio marinus]|uniref:S-adenosylmethionine:tRNA ribosyltransferase-isomerase n=1 Tax=Pleomorphovibrio marinus TaxID=2164132 RepID=UPI000E0BDF0B|nr:S-adenosylmethionine:tRNA ribosyltransferase-isomerase [Pleomorphovibrio marinus]
MQRFQNSDFHYDLPQERIAKFPLEERDLSKLLWYKNGDIRHYTFRQLPAHIPENSLMVFNNTKVIPARLYFKRETGALIEIFLLKPVLPSTLIQLAMEANGEATWECMIGNQKKWKDLETLNLDLSLGQGNIRLKARLVDREKRWVNLQWTPENTSFASVIEAIGEVPLPPYLNRKAEAEDKPRYQTVYSKNEGAVAAPTAGLHFTKQVLDTLQTQKTRLDYLTLHVSAGTFQPIKSEDPRDHPMHSEQMVFSRENLENLIRERDKLVAVGTTSLRSLESLYWYGVKLLNNQQEPFAIDKNDPYLFDPDELPHPKKAIEAVLKKMEEDRSDVLFGTTSIYIYPGYPFKMVDGLITNFHQPSSTLMLLVAAFVGEKWKKIYSAALEKNYRFLSYGDSSLLWK